MVRRQQPEFGRCWVFLQSVDVARPRPALALGDFELNPLVFLKIPVTRSHDQREMHQHVRITLPGVMNPRPFSPLNCFHPIILPEGCHFVPSGKHGKLRRRSGGVLPSGAPGGRAVLRRCHPIPSMQARIAVKRLIEKHLTQNQMFGSTRLPVRARDRKSS